MRRRIRLRPLTRRYLLPTTAAAAGRYVPPPPDPDDGPVRFGVTVPEVSMAAGEALAVYGGQEDRLWLWRDRHPESAEVHDGVSSTEAGVDMDWIQPTTEEEEQHPTA
ncbi:hypothetical protein [Dietzia kunjamensis]|uniref:hypothetical protein n=1 Tax=Dietzia kunjamensis TaxID=322509 RepID=UPI00388E1B5F